MDESAHPDQIGPYRILEEIGEGGMGTVFIAEQREPVRRRVALKLIKRGMDTKQVLARFEQERQALAVMSHDAIAKVYDAGETETGQPYFVMEHVEGLPITDYCDQHKLSIPARIELFRKVCAGVQHAHQKGVMHRDLKPSNVLVSLREGEHVPKIIDFGLARATDQRLVEQTIYTEQGQLIGTPEYMSPEQARGRSELIDTRTDVYSLGVLLYEVLTGELPFPTRELRAAGFAEILRKISEDEPQKPSTRISSVEASSREQLAKRREMRPQGLRKVLQGDLDWIVMRALAKEPERRYDTPTGLALDLKRHLEDEPVEAGPPTFGYRFSKFVQKNRAQFIAAVLVVAASLTFGSIAFVQFLRAEEKAEENGRLLVRETQAKNAAAQLAEEKSELAESERSAKNEAQTNLGRFEAKVTEFNQLAGVVRYEDAVAGVKALLEQPAWPAAIPAMESWLADCDQLLGMREDIERTIQRLREDALPWTAELEAAFEQAEPEAYAQWLLRGRVLASLRHAQSIRDGAPLPEVALSAEQQSLDATALNTLAWERVDPDSSKRKVWSEEPLGLVAARLAVEKSTEDPARFQFLDTLAWALLAEWCRDWYGAYGTERAGDGLNAVTGSSSRVHRGGSFDAPAVDARSANRSSFAPSVRGFLLGLRPARASRLED